VGSKLAPDAKNFLINMGKMYSSDFELDVIGNFAQESEINEFFKQRYYSGKQDAEGFTRIKQGFHNCKTYCLKEDPDLIFQITKYPIYGIVVSLTGKFYSTPTIVRLTGDHFRAYRHKADTFAEKVKIIAMQNIIGLLPLKLSTRVAVLSDKIKAEAVRNGCKEEKIDLLPQPIDKDRFSKPTDQEKEKLRRELDLPKNKNVIIYVGRLTKPKGLDMLQEALSAINRDDFLFCLIGSGEYGPKLKNKYPSLVRLEGFVDTQKVHDYYRAADLLVHPSPLEGVPNTILEAMSVEIPVFARDADYSRDLNVPTFKNSKELIEILKKDWKTTPLPNRFGWNTLKDRYLKVFKKTAGEDKDV